MEFCFFSDPVKLAVANFRVLREGSDVTMVSVGDVASLSMSVEIQTTSGSWPKPMSDEDSVFDIRLFIRSMQCI